MRPMQATQLMKIALLFGVMLMISAQTRAESDQAGIDATSIEDGRRLKTHNLSFAVSVDSVVQDIKRKRDVSLIDVRGRHEFDAVHIPGSINIPLYSIKTKPFLKTGRLVLVGNGHLYGPLADECEKLAEKGFHASILWGGLNAWKQKGLDLEGDVFEAEKINLISPRDFHLEKDYQGNTCILISGGKNKDYGKDYPCFTHIEKLEDDSIKSLAGSGDKQQLRLIFIGNEDGEGYDQYKELVEKSGLSNVFFLSGGLKGYKKFLEKLSLSLRSRESRLQLSDRCVPCGK